MKHISVVLVEPEHAGNVGAAARAMNNMGFTEMRLVNPCDLRRNTHNGADALAAHSEFILNSAAVYPSLRDAVADKQLIVCLTARIRAEHQSPVSIWNLHNYLKKFEGQSIAFVFGRESTGLTNAEADLCNVWMTIPTFGINSSLNLAQAVMTVLYEASRYFYADDGKRLIEENTKSNSNAAKSFEIENLKTHLFVLLEKIGYLKQNNRATKWSLFSDVLATKALTSKEVNMLRGVLSRVEGAMEER